MKRGVQGASGQGQDAVGCCNGGYVTLHICQNPTEHKPRTQGSCDVCRLVLRHTCTVLARDADGGRAMSWATPSWGRTARDPMAVFRPFNQESFNDEFADRDILSISKIQLLCSRSKLWKQPFQTCMKVYLKMALKGHLAGSIGGARNS